MGSADCPVKQTHWIDVRCVILGVVQSVIENTFESQLCCGLGFSMPLLHGAHELDQQYEE